MVKLIAKKRADRTKVETSGDCLWRRREKKKTRRENSRRAGWNHRETRSLERKSRTETQNAGALQLDDAVAASGCRVCWYGQDRVTLQDGALIGDVERIHGHLESDAAESEILRQPDIERVRVVETGLADFFDEHELAARAGLVDSGPVSIKNRIALPGGEVDAKVRLDEGDLINAGQVERPVGIDPDPALVAGAGRLLDLVRTVAVGATGTHALRSRVVELRIDVLLPVVPCEVAA